jgi:hypothetical protein
MKNRTLVANTIVIWIEHSISLRISRDSNMLCLPMSSVEMLSSVASPEVDHYAFRLIEREHTSGPKVVASGKQLECG